MVSRSLRRGFAAALAMAALTACQPEIGDACERSTDCSLRGERVCDLSHLVRGKGECTIDGCSRDNCPGEALCVKTYSTKFLSVACDPVREDVAVPIDPEQCDQSSCPGLPPLDDCGPNEVCLPEGLCADHVSARTSCRRKCDDDDDCRSGYRCFGLGVDGLYRSPDPDHPELGTKGRICVPMQ